MMPPSEKPEYVVGLANGDILKCRPANGQGYGPKVKPAAGMTSTVARNTDAELFRGMSLSGCLP
jgi:hypothetical protein